MAKTKKKQYNILIALCQGYCLLQAHPVNTKHLYNICTMLDQRRRRWADVVQILYKCFVFTGQGIVQMGWNFDNVNLSPCSDNKIRSRQRVVLQHIQMAHTTLWLPGDDKYDNTNAWEMEKI